MLKGNEQRCERCWWDQRGITELFTFRKGNTKKAFKPAPYGQKATYNPNSDQNVRVFEEYKNVRDLKWNKKECKSIISLLQNNSSQ